MFDPNSENTKNLFEKYKALFEFAIKHQENTALSIEQIKAIGERVLNECIETAMNNQSVPIEEREKILNQFMELIQQQCPDMIFDSPLKFDDDGFELKK